MTGLLGIAQLGDARLDAAGLDALLTQLPGATGPVIRGPRGRVSASGWAQALEGPDGVHVAGAAHLVNLRELAAVCGTKTSLETVAALYRGYGPEGLARLQGQFCLAVFDTRSEQLVLATDRFATRPIYYAEQPNRVVFGTSLTRVAAQGDRTIDHQAILEYLLYAVVPSPRTPFAAVRKLPAAHLLIANPSGIRVHPYWDMAYQESRNGNAASWARQLRDEIENAVRRYVTAEESTGELGAFLSGGTDSSTVAGMMGAIIGQPTRTFSIGYVETGYDELDYAAIAARWFGARQCEKRVSPGEALDALPAIVAYYEEPFGNASALPTYCCAALARQHAVTVMFAGDGGDELFAGNARYASDKIFALYQRIPGALRRTIVDPALAAFPEGVLVLGRARRYAQRANIPNPRRILSYHPLLSAPLDESLTDSFLAAVAADEILATAEAHYRRPAPGTSELNRLLYVDLKLAIADNDVRKVSGMTELAGVQVRYPFLDVGLAEFSGRIPSGLKLRGFQKRYVFKQALADFLPPEVLKKPKHGFGAPIALWMRNDPRWRGFIGDLLHDPRTRQRGYIKPTVLDDFWKRVNDEGAPFYGDSLWPWLMLELWHREHVDGRGMRRTDGN